MNPLKQQEVATGFTIAELYQAMHQDIAAGPYDEAGILNRAQWTYDELTGACTAAITLATQQGRDRFAPTPTPPLDRMETYAYATGTSEESDGTTTTTKTFPQVAEVRASYIQPTPGKIDRSPVRVDATAWNDWEGRPIAIVADGVAVFADTKRRDGRRLSDGVDRAPSWRQSADGVSQATFAPAFLGRRDLNAGIARGERPRPAGQQRNPRQSPDGDTAYIDRARTGLRFPQSALGEPRRRRSPGANPPAASRLVMTAE